MVKTVNIFLQSFSKNAYIYHGANNSLSKARQLVTDWMCSFDMSWYPFGIQTCDMRFYVIEEDIKLVPKEILFNGNKFHDLKSFKHALLKPDYLIDHLIIPGKRRVGMYSFQDMVYCQLPSVADSHQGILVETFLYRPLLTNILSQFLPTLLFLLIRS